MPHNFSADPKFRISVTTNVSSFFIQIFFLLADLESDPCDRALTLERFAAPDVAFTIWLVKKFLVTRDCSSRTGKFGLAINISFHRSLIVSESRRATLAAVPEALKAILHHWGDTSSVKAVSIVMTAGLFVRIAPLIKVKFTMGISPQTVTMVDRSRPEVVNKVFHTLWTVLATSNNRFYERLQVPVIKVGFYHICPSIPGDLVVFKIPSVSSSNINEPAGTDYAIDPGRDK